MTGAAKGRRAAGPARARLKARNGIRGCWPCSQAPLMGCAAPIPFLAASLVVLRAGRPAAGPNAHADGALEGDDLAVAVAQLAQRDCLDLCCGVHVVLRIAWCSAPMLAVK